MFTGSYVALITPFSKGRVDEKKLRDLVEWHIAEKTDGLVPVGTTGESATLSHKEHGRVIEVVVKAARGRVPVVAGAGSNSTDEAVALTKEAARLGANGVLSVNPYYNRPTQPGLFAHFSAVASASKLPVILYNIPSRTGVTVSVDTMVRLAKRHENIVGVKEATGSMDMASEVLERLGKRFTVLSGDDSLTLPLMAIGAMGAISVAANVAPAAVARLCHLGLAGRFDEARAVHLKLFPLIKSLFIETNPGPVKAAMAELGLIKDESLRLPMVTVEPSTRAALKTALKKVGLKSQPLRGRP